MSWGYRPYVSVAQRRADARREMQKLRKQGRNIQPVEIEGRTIARSFWGKGWCDHLESFSDYSNRLPRGRTYVRNGSVCHLEIAPGRIDAIVSGSELYNVTIDINKLSKSKWKAVKKKCSGRIGSILELLQGRLSDQVMGIVSDRRKGLFPSPNEIKLSCDCPDWAVMCKHVAAVLYGVGARLDTSPELLFLLRDVDAQELITADITIPAAGANDAGDTISDDELGGIFGVEMDDGAATPVNVGKSPKRVKKKTASQLKKKSKKKTAAKSKPKKTAPRKKSATSKTAKKQNTAKQGETTSVAKAGSAKKSTRRKAEEANLYDHQSPFLPTGETVAELRKLSGLSGAAFAKQLGVSPATVYRWEKTKGFIHLHDRTISALRKMDDNLKKQLIS